MKQKVFSSFQSIKESFMEQLSIVKSENFTINYLTKVALGVSDIETKVISRGNEAEVMLNDGTTLISIHLINGRVDRLSGDVRIDKISPTFNAQILNTLKF
jgi:hypothetical protein